MLGLHGGEQRVRLVVGLGNPGEEYRGTRHNLGFEACETFAKRRRWNYWKTGYHGLYVEGTYRSEEVVLLKPGTYMNRSGRAAQAAVAHYRLSPEQVLVVLDDLALPLGRLRVRVSGSHGGHRGLESIVEVLGEDVPRLRLGIGEAQGDAARWVLKPFRKDEKDEAAILVERAADALETCIAEGLTAAMNKYNA